MLLFWTACAVMAIGALLYSLWPLIRRGHAGAPAALPARLAAYQASLDELERDAANGSIAPAELAAAREDIQRAILQSAAACGKSKESQETGHEAKHPTKQKARLLPLLLGGLLPLLSLSIYLHLGQHRLIHGDILAGGAGTAGATQTPASVEAMVAGLAAALQQRPDDVSGWSMLARAYMALGRYADALAAYEHLYSIAPESPAVLVAYAAALSMTNAGKLAGRPQALLEKALQLEPLNRAGLWLAGLAAEQAGNDRAAIALWQTLLAQSGDDEAAIAQIEQALTKSRARLAMTAAAAKGAPAKETTKEATKEAPEKEVAKEVAKEAALPLAEKRTLTLRVSLASALSARAASGTVFVVARAPGATPMPLAVVRRQVSALPFTVTLDDAAAMAPAARLSDHETVEVSARVSLSGRATRQPGDLSSAWLRVDTARAETVMLSIDRVLD